MGKNHTFAYLLKREKIQCAKKHGLKQLEMHFKYPFAFEIKKVWNWIGPPHFPI